MSDPTDASLVRSCREGNRRAQLALVENHQGPVFQVSLRILGNREDAADATQATFLKVFERLDQYDDAYRLFSWIYRIAVNEAIDQLKRARAHDELPEDLVSGDIGPEGTIDADRISRALQSGLNGLPEDYRVALVLRHFSDCSYGEIAMIVGVPEKTVKSRIHSARLLLRERLLALGVRVG